MLQCSEVIKNILIVDTHQSDTNRLARELPGDRFAITCAGSADEAVRLLRNRDYDAALIEMDSPRVDPIGLLHKMRRECPMMKVLMMTDYGDEEMWIDVLNEGADDLLAKPITLRDVQRRL